MLAQLLPVAGLVFLAMQHSLDGAMDQQVRIAPDGRCEVRIRLVRQAEVADIVRAVDRLLHRSQQHGLQQLFIRPAAELLQQLAVVLGMRAVAATHAEAELAHKGAQGFEFFRSRPFMDAVQRRMFMPLEEIRRADIGCQHALLDDAMRLVTHHGLNPLDLAVIIEDHHGFTAIELNGSTFCARLDHDLIKLIEMLHVRHQPGMFPGRFTLRIDQHVIDLGIGHARL